MVPCSDLNAERFGCPIRHTSLAASLFQEQFPRPCEVGEEVRFEPESELRVGDQVGQLRAVRLDRGPLPFEHLRRYMDEIVTVSEDSMAHAMRELAHRARLVIEPSGAAAMGAHLAGSVRQSDADDARVVILSGENVDPDLFVRILAEG